MRRYILLTICVVAALLVGCNNSIQLKVTPQPFQKVSFNNTVEDVMTFTVSSDNELYVVEGSGPLKRYKNDGTLIQEYSNTNDFTALCWDDGVLYAYDAVKYQIVSLNIQTGEIKIIVKDFKNDEILKLAISDGYLYALVVPEAHTYFETGLNGYIDCGEELYQIDISKSKIKDTKEDNIIALYGDSNGNIYYYAYRDGAYKLFSYNSKNRKSSLLYDMSDVGYISAFVYEGDNLVYSVLEDMSVKTMRLSDGLETQVDDGIIILSGNEMCFQKGNILYFGISADDMPSTIQSAYLGDIWTNGGDDNNKSSNIMKNKSEGTVVISTPLRAYINPDSIEQISGIKTKIIDQSLDYEALLTEIMAGNPDVDIYITFYGSYLASGIREKGIYVPLNSSDTISAYKNKCFGYIADAMSTRNGEIWMLPISLDGYVIWYIPDNIKKFNIKSEDFLYLDNFLNLSERMPNKGSYAAYVDYAGNFGMICHNQYDMTYNDYDNKNINFNTPLYKHIFDKMWTGWINNSENPRHPLFRDSRDDYNGELMSESSQFDNTKVIYKISSIGEQFKVAGTFLEYWRALPLPRISSDVKGNYVIMTCAFINPNSKNKELALDYLEALTQVPFDFNSLNQTAFFFKDKKMYSEQFDTDLPCFEDTYNILQNGILKNTSFDLNPNIVDDYQNGRLTLDEAVDKIQREAEMWIYE